MKLLKYTSGLIGLVILIFLLIGGIGLWGGSELLIKGAVSLATRFNVEERIIGVTIISIGTSVPELAASVIAVIKKEKAISLGNLLGSNVFNIFLILGVSALIIPLNAVNSIGNLLILMVVTLVMFPVLYTGHVISRKEGVFLLVLYLFFICYIFLA